MLKLLHTADLHLGNIPNTNGLNSQARDRVHQQQWRTLEWIVNYAHANSMDAILIAGDLFHYVNTSPETSEFAIEIFNAFRPRPIFIAPGNHDPLDTCFAWQNPHWPEHVTIAQDSVARPYRIPYTEHDIVMHAWTTQELTQSPLLNVDRRPPPSARRRILMGHGSAVDAQPADWKTYAPFNAANLPTVAVDYIALGHLHNWQRVPTRLTPPAVYPGAPYPTTRAEVGPRHVARVHIDAVDTQVQKVETPGIMFHSAVFAMNQETTTAQLRNYLCSTKGKPLADTLLKLTLLGEPPGQVWDALPKIIEQFRHLYLQLDVDDLTMNTARRLRQLEPGTALAEYLLDLDRRIEQQTDPEAIELLKDVRLHSLARALGTTDTVRRL